tara:strand:+ start:11989 stop:12495 length:507 start_codon:yes stop_codon:yes gene_type:complete
MHQIGISDKLEIKTSSIQGAGLGVFAKADIPAGTIIETCPVKLLSTFILDDDDMHKTWLIDYTFSWNEKFAAVCFGWGSFYNHSEEYNTHYSCQEEPMGISFKTVKRVKKGEELFIRYRHPSRYHELDFIEIQEHQSSPDKSYTDRTKSNIQRRRLNRDGSLKDYLKR